MYRRLLPVALLLTAAAVLPQRDAQHRCPRNDQVPNIQPPPQQQFQPQHAQRQVAQATQRRITEPQRTVEATRMQAESKSRSVTTTQSKSVPTQTTTLVSRAREVTTPTRTATSSSRSVTTTESGVI